MNENVNEILERAAERYADDIIKRVESRHISPPTREAWRTQLAAAYFTGAAELMEVLQQSQKGNK